jgi:hypothetical protein
LFVLVDLGLPAGRHKPAVKIATMPFPVAANRENPCPSAFRTGWYFRHSRVVIGHNRARCVQGAESALTCTGCLIMPARGTMMA